MSKIKEEARLLRIKQVSEITGLAVSTIWKYVKLGEFPRPFKLSMRVTVWDSTEVNKWVNDILKSDRNYTPDNNTTEYYKRLSGVNDV